MTLSEVERPQPGDQDLLIRIHAASVNPIDCLIRSGAMRRFMGDKFPICPGYDVAGVVESVGSRVNRFNVGDAVFATSNKRYGEAYAEYIVLPESVVADMPSRLSFVEAAAVPGAALTALQSLRNLAHIRPGQRVLIIGGSGGVGTHAVQIAKAYDTQVTAVCSGRNQDLVRSLGADAVIDYTQESILSRGDSYDIVFDAVGTQNFSSVRPHLTREGVLVTTTNGMAPRFSRLLRLVGFKKRAAFVRVKADGNDLKDLAHLINEGKLTPIIEATYPLAAAAEAHTRSETNRVRGKLVLTVNANLEQLPS